MKKALICFTRVPRPGQTKTRLLGFLTPEQCAGLHWAFLRDLAGVYATVDAALFVSHTPDPDWGELREVFPGAAGFFPQQGENLGQRMDHALRQVLALGYEAVVLTGADLPNMTAGHLNSGFDELARNDLTLGPTADGGYYLVGTKGPCPEIFTGQQYGGASVWENTLVAAYAAGYRVGIAKACGDVDTPEDLRNLCPAAESATGQYLAMLKKKGVAV